MFICETGLLKEDKLGSGAKMQNTFLSNITILVACYATLHPALLVCPLVRQSVGPLVRHTLLFWRLWVFWLCSYCLYAPLT